MDARRDSVGPASGGRAPRLCNGPERAPIGQQIQDKPSTDLTYNMWDVPIRQTVSSPRTSKPVVARDQTRRGLDNTINNTDRDVVLIINNPPIGPHWNNKQDIQRLSGVDTHGAQHQYLKTNPIGKSSEITPYFEPVVGKNRSDSVSPSERDFRRNRGQSFGDESRGGYRFLKTPEPPKAGRRRGSLEAESPSSRDRHRVKSLEGSSLVNRVEAEDDWNKTSGTRGRSHSDVRYDALPLLDSGELDLKSFRLGRSHSTPSDSALLKDKPKHEQPKRFTNTTSLPRRFSKSREKLYPLEEEQIFETPSALNKYPLHKEIESAEKQQPHTLGVRKDHFKDQCQGDETHRVQPPTSPSRHQRRNAVVDIMDNLAERNHSETLRAERNAAAIVVPDELVRPRRDSGSLNPTMNPTMLRFRLIRDAVIPKRRRAYSDVGKLSRKLSITSQQRLNRHQVARRRFAHAIRMVILMLRIHSMVFKKHKTGGKQSLTFTEIAEQLPSDDLKTSGLSFDPRDFKAKREINLTTEAKNILSMPSSIRTAEQLQTALYGLQTMKSFAEYPLHMQEKLVKVAWFESVPPKRVIIRQGHYAENFYFVISGSAVVTIMETKADTGEPQIRTAAVLRKGSSFGELALLHHSKRTATVSSQGDVQLLAIGREDFFDIFMRGQQPGEEPDHVKFLRRGQVVVKDSNKSDWIYIVKSGSCQVLKQLKAVKPSKTQRSESTNDLRLPRLHTRHHSAPDLAATSSSKRPMTTRVRNNSAVASHLQFLALPTMSPVHTSQSLEFDSNYSSQDQMDSNRSLPDTFMTRQRSAVETAPSESNFSQYTSNDDPALFSLPNIDFRRGATPARQSFSRSKFRRISSMNPSPSPERTPLSFIPQVTVTESNTTGSDSSSSSDKKESSVFVQLELLLPKDVFGLSTLSLDLGIDHEQSSVNLVSRGAECIMVQKDFFAKYCTEHVKRHIRKLVKPYPPPELLQHNLQNHSNWTNYKHEAVASLLKDRSKAKTLRL
ncbi:uncharacterized protein [Asterias amurensis]|uniref:uncharacterized protein isoform X2 n=1 Tax=Asterias amurensis TaxID=7602 RepID=UPI003AB61A08